MVQSHISAANHWALCFAYELRVPRLPKLKRWRSEMRFVPFTEAAAKMNLGRGHLDILKEVRYL